MIGFSEQKPSSNYTVVALRGEGNRIVNISLYANVEEIEADKWYQVEFYNLQIISDKSEAEIMQDVENDWDGYLRLAKAQMNKEAVENSEQIDQTALALTDVYEMLLG